MAGKLHRDYLSYGSATGSFATAVAPEKKHARAYAEGYNARRNGLAQATNPHPSTPTDTASDFWTWDRGWQDAQAKFDPTHVGGTNQFT